MDDFERELKEAAYTDDSKTHAQTTPPKNEACVSNGASNGFGDRLL